MTLPQADKPSVSDLIRDIVSDTKENQDYISSNFTHAGIQSKVTNFDRDLTAASGNVAYAGIGFKPTTIIFMRAQETNDYLGLAVAVDNAGTVYQMCVPQDYTTGWATKIDYIFGNGSTSDAQNAVLASFDVDGFTLTWTKGGTPTGTAKYIALCLRK